VGLFGSMSIFTYEVDDVVIIRLFDSTAVGAKQGISFYLI
jgi:hypothetical protein